MTALMNKKVPQGKGLAEFMERRGKRVVEAAGSYWHSTEGRMYMSLPYHLPLEPAPGEVRGMLWKNQSLGVRYPSARRAGSPSGLYVCREKGYSLKNVQSRLRSKVRRGLENCVVREVEPGELLREGLRLNLETMTRQGRFEDEFGDETKFRRIVEAIEQSPTVCAMGSFVNGVLAAYCVTYEEEGWFHILHQMSRLDQLDFYPNHALTFTLTERALAKPEIEGMSYGLKSLVNTAGLHDFKLRMGFDCIPQNMVCELHPAASPILTSGLAAWGLKEIRRRIPEDQRWMRVEAVISAARAAQGRSPLLARRVEEMESQEAA